jgi:hypothetical protein
VLSGLAVCAALTAAVAGVAGAWSPCGFSMIETIGSALGDARRGATLIATLTFALGTLLGGAITFGGLGLLGSLFNGAGAVRAVLGAAIAFLAAVADWRGMRIAPQIRRQVPERWRWTLPLPLACALYGVLLGLGFTTFVLAFAVWALAGISFALGAPLLGVLVGVAFGAGRALPVLWLAPALRGGSGAGRLDGMAREPRLLLGLRRLGALGLALCALVLVGVGATASARASSAARLRSEAATTSAAAARGATGESSLAGATDPSAAGGELAWQPIGGAGALRTDTGAVSALPGMHPALGGRLVAWASAGAVTVADGATLAPRLTLPAVGANALALSPGWLAYRALGAGGAERLIAVALADPSRARVLAGPSAPGQIGRPSLDGSLAVFALDNRRRSVIELVDLETGRERPLRIAARGAQLANPSLLARRLLFERTTRCAQQLALGPAIPPRVAAARRSRDRTLLWLRSTVRRDPGWQPGYEHAYNVASVCGDRGAGGGGDVRLGPTALAASRAYVTEVAGADARIVSLAR